MYKAAEDICVSNSALWATLTAFGNAFSLYQAKIDEIENLHTKQQTDIKGITENKNNKISELISTALSISKPMIAFANVTNNPQLRQEINYSENKLKRSSDSDLEARCTIIKERANVHIAALADYGVTPPMLAALGTALSNFKAVISGPRTALSLKKQHTAEIQILFKATDKILKGQLDQLMVLFQKTAPEFYGAYKNARIIIDLGTHIHTYSGKVLPVSIKMILDTATDDNEIFEISNYSTETLTFGRGANSTDVGSTSKTVNPGETKTFTALELGAPPNKFLNVKNSSTKQASYKVLRL
jgi:hypothetical protein